MVFRRLACLLAACGAPALAQGNAHPPIPRNPPMWLAGDADIYPAAARRANAQGRVDYTLAIDATGRVTGCRVTTSSGNADLDLATCRIMQSHARFDPAVDADGKAVPGEWSKSFDWVLPG